MMSKIEVARIVEGHKMNMHMRHINTDNSLANFNTGANLLKSLSNTLGKKMQFGEQFVIEVEDIVNFFLRNAENMSLDNGIDVQESKAMLSFGHFIAGNLSCDYLAEYSCHIIFLFW